MNKMEQNQAKFTTKPNLSLLGVGIVLMLISTIFFCHYECYYQIPKYDGIFINGKCIFSCLFYDCISLCSHRYFSTTS